MLRSSERRPRRFSVRQGLVVTDVRCGKSKSTVVVYGATDCGGDESGVSPSGEERTVRFDAKRAKQSDEL